MNETDTLSASDFVEPREEFKGISQYYDETIRPTLVKIEANRAKSVKKGFIAAIVTAVCLFPAALWLPPHLGWSDNSLLFFVGAMIATYLAYYLATFHIAPMAKSTVMNGLTAYLGWRYADHPNEIAVFESLKSYGLFPRHNRHNFSDHIQGSALGHNFELSEICLRQKGDKTERTVFQGMLLSIDFKRDFSGKTIVKREKWLQLKRNKDMKRVGLVSAEFEALFEAYSTDQVEARYLLTPDFMQDLIDLEKSVQGEKVRLAFLDNVLHVIIETPDRFEIRNIRRSLINPEIIQTFINEFNAVFELIEGLDNRLSA